MCKVFLFFFSKLKKKKFISQQHIMWVYKIHETLQKKKKLIYLKQLTLQDMFINIKDCSANKSYNSGSHCSTSITFCIKKMLIKVFNC